MIDAADGLVDGKVFNLEHWTSPSETQRLKYLRTKQDLVADRVTSFAGSLKFVYIHAVWFGVWIILNVGLVHLGIKRFDKYPFGLLTMIVSLEAIFLATFVMVSQNRQAKRSDLRAQIDFESNLRSLIMVTHLAANQGVDLMHVNEIVDLAIKDSHSTLGDETVPKSSKHRDAGSEPTSST
ncbi:MAG: DUF1003 domain-containing protein [Actinomycetes bacterium]